MTVSIQSQARQHAKQTSAEKEASTKKMAVKRYNLALPASVFDEVSRLAQQENTSMLEFLKRLIKIGLVVFNIVQSPNTTVIIKQGETERELVLL